MNENKNIPASIKAKLKNISIKENKSFDFVLMLYMIERLIFRISISKYKDNFILKGGLLLYVKMEEKSRPTKDIDFLAKHLSNDISIIHNIFKDICILDYSDGLSFESKSIISEKIKEDADYEGVRIKIKCYLEKSFKVIQLDIGFGDIVIPQPIILDYPILLEMNQPKINAYSMESVISEKFEAMISLSLINSRMKDFYDIFMLSSSYTFEGKILYKAVFETFKRRGTTLSECPIIFTEDFYTNKSKQTQWTAFINRIVQKIDFKTAMIQIYTFLKPIYDSLLIEKEFDKNWDQEKWV